MAHGRPKYFLRQPFFRFNASEARLPIFGIRWETDGENRSFSQLTNHIYLTALQLDQLLYNHQPEPCTFFLNLTATLVFYPVEPVPNVR